MISKSKFLILVHSDLLVILSINTAFFICAMLFGPSFVISTLGSSLVVVTFCLESFCSIFSFQQHNGREGVINQKKLLINVRCIYVLRFVQYVHCCRLQVVYSPVTVKNFATSVDFWQARRSEWWPHHQNAIIAAAMFYSVRSRQDWSYYDRSYQFLPAWLFFSHTYFQY